MTGWLECDYRLTAAVVRVDAVGDKAGLEVARSAKWTSGYAQIFRHNKFDALDLDIPAGRKVMGWDGHCLHAALMLPAFFIYLR